MYLRQVTIMADEYAKSRELINISFPYRFFYGSRDLIEERHQRELRARPTEPQRDIQAPQWTLPNELLREIWPHSGHFNLNYGGGTGR